MDVTKEASFSSSSSSELEHLEEPTPETERGGVAEGLRSQGARRRGVRDRQEIVSFLKIRLMAAASNGRIIRKTSWAS